MQAPLHTEQYNYIFSEEKTAKDHQRTAPDSNLTYTSENLELKQIDLYHYLSYVVFLFTCLSINYKVQLHKHTIM